MSYTLPAVNYARAQVGKSYLFGAAGPDAFDCSGLVMRALEQIKVVLPHQSGQQAQWFADHKLLMPNTPDSRRHLIPGDVVFYYGDLTQTASITHCALYVGRGLSGRRRVVAAVDTDHGVMNHRMYHFLGPVGFGFTHLLYGPA